MLSNACNLVAGECYGVAHIMKYMHTIHAWLTVQMLWQVHGRTLQAVHMLIVCMGMPSMDAEARKLWSRFSALHQAGRPMIEHVNECMIVNY